MTEASMVGLDHLTASTQAQYMRAFTWLQKEYHGSYERTEPIQLFFNEHPRCKGMQGRIVQSVVNRHLHPRPHGPPITIMNTPRPQAGSAKRVSPGVWLHEDGAWVGYIPVHLKERVTQQLPAQWQQWLRHFVMQTLQANPLKRNLIRSYVSHAYQVMIVQLQCMSLDAVLRLSHVEVVQAVFRANPMRVHQRRLCRIAINHLLGSTVLREHPACALRLHLRSKDFSSVPGGSDGDHPADYAIRAPGRVRDHFTQSEMDAILALPALSLRDRLMLHIMAETGLRRRAVSWLLVDCVFDQTAKDCLPVGRALEKGLITRPFSLSQTTASLMKEYMMNEHPGVHSRWLFPSCKKGHLYPITPSAVNSVLLRACVLANIRGRHTHTHAIRKFVVCTLMKHKNRIEEQGSPSRWAPAV